MATFIHRACTHTNPVIGRDCSPTDDDNGGTTTPPTPQAPTEIDITPGPGTLHITWKPNGPPATRWRISAHRVGRQGIGPDPEYQDTNITADPATGHTITALAFNAAYIIEIQGFNQHPGATAQKGATTQRAAVRLVALEITQGLQNWNGDIGLVKGKRTVVRAYLEPTSRTPTRVRVTLSILDGDGNLISTILPNNTNAQGMDSELDYFITDANAAGRRREIDASANFVLDDARWIGSPGGSNLTLTYRLNVSPRADCLEAIDPDVRCGAEITLSDVKPPQVVVVPLLIGGTRPTGAMIVEHVRRIKSLMPVPGVEFISHAAIKPEFPDPLPPDKTEQQASSGAIFKALNEIRVGYPKAVILGIGYELKSGWGIAAYNGAALAGSRVAWWKMDKDKARIGSDIYGRNTGSHEFGHLLGAGHAVYDDGSDTYRVACRDRHEEGATMAYPYLDPVPTDTKPADFKTKALLGPTAGPSAVWGLDTRLFDGTMALPAMLAVMDPSETFSIMSYCSSGVSDGRQDRWVDEHYHKMFLASLVEDDWGPKLAGAAPAEAGSGGAVRDVLVVGGSRSVGGDGSAEVALSPTYTYATGAAVGSQRGGEWMLELLDSEGAVLRSVAFAADTPVVDIDPDSHTEPDAESELWRVAVPDPPAYSSYRIRRGSEVVAESELSAAAPAVSVTAPAAAQMFSGDSVAVSWTASDADGDDLVYHVHYSDDGGATYSTVGVALTSTTLVLDRGQLAGSTRARFRVIASDGTRSTSVESPIFTIAENPPTVIVHSPDNSRVYGGPGTIVLDATGIDAEDGVMADTALVWTSDIDGQIAATATARVDTADLTAGTHVLTVTATDSDNMTTSASVTVTVRATNGAPAALPDTSRGRAGRAVTARVLANDSDPESDIDPWSLRVLVPSALGAATAAGRPDPGAIAYRAPSTGVDVVVYEVCDRFLQGTTAELVIVILDDS